MTIEEETAKAEEKLKDDIRSRLRLTDKQQPTPTPSARYSVDEIAKIVEICRAAGIREFHYHELRFVFEGTKDGKAETALRNPALRNLLDGVGR